MKYSKLTELFKHSAISESLSGRKFYSLAAGQPGHKAPNVVLSAARKAINQKNKGYANPQGSLELRKAIVKKLKRENKICADENNIIVTNGSQEGFLLTMTTLLNRGDEVILLTPAFFGYAPDIIMLGGKIRKVKLSLEDDFLPDVDKIKKHITKKTKAIVINTPNNPTGAVYPRSILEEIADLAVEHDLFIISDEAYEKFVYEGSHVSIASLNGMEDRVITLHSFSKSLALPAFRLGYIVASHEFVSKAKNLMLALTVCASLPYQLALAQTLDKLASYYRSLIKEYKAKRNLVTEALNKYGVEYAKPKGAFYVFPKIDKFAEDDLTFLDFLKTMDVIAVPGRDFGDYKNFIRISYSAEISEIREAVKRLEKLLKSLIEFKEIMKEARRVHSRLMAKK